MKLRKASIDEVKRGRIYNSEYRNLIEEFIKMDVQACEILGYTCKRPCSVTKKLKDTIKEYGYDSIYARTVNGRPYLIKTNNEE